MLLPYNTGQFLDVFGGLPALSCRDRSLGDLLILIKRGGARIYVDSFYSVQRFMNIVGALIEIFADMIQAILAVRCPLAITFSKKDAV